MSGATPSKRARSWRTRSRSVVDSGKCSHHSRCIALNTSPLGAAKLCRCNTARSRLRMRVRCQIKRWRCATRPRSSRTSIGGTQTVGIRPAPNKRARVRASLASVLTDDLAINATLAGFAITTAPTKGCSWSCRSQALDVASSTTTSMGWRLTAAHLPSWSRSTRRGPSTMRWASSTPAATTYCLWTSKAIKRTLAAVTSLLIASSIAVSFPMVIHGALFGAVVSIH